MKLRNKKTGEIIDVYKGEITLHYNQGRKTIHFKRLEDLENWEDYEEPEGWWFIDQVYEPHATNTTLRSLEADRQIGNYFTAQEEAEKAVEKLKAWKRLKDVGFKFTDWHRDICEVAIEAEIHDDGTMGMITDLDLLFGGEE